MKLETRQFAFKRNQNANQKLKPSSKIIIFYSYLQSNSTWARQKQYLDLWFTRSWQAVLPLPSSIDQKAAWNQKVFNIALVRRCTLAWQSCDVKVRRNSRGHQEPHYEQIRKKPSPGRMWLIQDTTDRYDMIEPNLDPKFVTICCLFLLPQYFPVHSFLSLTKSYVAHHSNFLGNADLESPSYLR